MARSRRRPYSQAHSVSSHRRDPFQIARSPLYTLRGLSVIPLQDIEDRRTWHPERVRPFASLWTPRHRLEVLPPPNASIRAQRGKGRLVATRGFRPEAHQTRPAGGRLPIGIRFRGAQSVLVCIRRQRRREVIAAKHGLGRKGPRRRRARRNASSSISCRR